MNIFSHFHGLIAAELTAMMADGSLKTVDLGRVAVEPPRDPAHGDLATNAAMVLAKPAGLNPRALGDVLAKRIEKLPDVRSVDVAGPGFINLRLSPAIWPKLLTSALAQGEKFGASDLGRGLKVNCEYVSANPTGPLHVGHVRGAVFGDALAQLLTEAGYDVSREYYINDAGGQVDVLARSAYLRYREALGEAIGEIPAGLYPGDYLKPVGAALAAQYGNSLLAEGEQAWLPSVKAKAVDMMMAVIKDDLATLDIRQEVFFSEMSLHDSGKIRDVVEKLRAKGDVFQGRLEKPKGEASEDWEDREQTLFRSSAYGDDVDRPLMKSNGDYTYFAADVAYAENKISRGFRQLIYVLGADHGGYVKRLEAVSAALAGKDVQVVCRLCQLVKLFRNGEPVRMSKRAGEFVTLQEVVDEVGPDVTRFMMLYRKNEAPLDFDFAKVTEQSKDNPVFYVNYAHARISSVFRKAAETADFTGEPDFALLTDEAELQLVRRVAEYPRLIEAAALSHEPHRIAFYLYDLASDFHSLWNKGKESPHLRFIVDEDQTLTTTRLAFCRIVRYVLANGLRILGVRPVEEM